MSLSLLLEDTVKPWCNIRCQNATIDEDVNITGNTINSGYVAVGDDLLVDGTSSLAGNTTIGNVSNASNLHIYGNLTVAGSYPSPPPEALPEIEWTPTLKFGGSDVGITYATRRGVYVRSGNIIVFSCEIRLTSKGSSTGPATISGFPFASTITTYNFPIAWELINTSAGYYILAELDKNDPSEFQIKSPRNVGGFIVYEDNVFYGNSYIQFNGIVIKD